MKGLLIVLFSLVTCVPLLAANALPSKVSKVVIFRNGAQVTRIAKVNLKLGENELVLGKLPAGFDESSIQLRTLNQAEITAVSYRNNFENQFEGNEEYKKLKNQIEVLQRSREDEVVIFDTWREEENLILSNKNVSGANNGLSSVELAKTGDLYRTRLKEVKIKILESRRRIVEIDANLAKANNQLNEWTGKNKETNNGEVVVTILASKAGEDLLELLYIDHRANWISSFDLRLESIGKPLNLVSKGKITQYTGEDWKDITLVLSTGNSRQNFIAPDLQPWFLYYAQSYAKNDNYQSGYVVQGKASENANIRSISADEIQNVGVKENITFTEYTLKNLLSIPSDQKQHEVKLEENEIEANYKYYTVPKIEPKVYLIADIPDWSRYNLSSGTIKLFFEGTFIGNSTLDINNVEDTLQISLGPDIGIVTKRENLKDFKKTSFLSSKKQVSVGWEITIKNNKTKTIEVTVEDQIPLSTDSEMEIKVDELSGGKLNNDNGIVTWNLTLKPGEQIKKRIAYTVKIPNSKRVVL